MNSTLKQSKPDLQSLPSELIDLGKSIADLPIAIPFELTESYDRVLKGVQRRRRILGLIQESLSQLRLDVKYLVFDLEATRQERDQLKAQLEND